MLNPDTWKIVTSLIFSDKHLPGLSTEASVFHLKFACHVESTPVQINNMKKHTKKKHLRRASNNKCRMLITSLREEKMAQQCEPSSGWSFVCEKSVEGKKSVRYVHMYTIYKPGTQYRIEITTIQTVAMRLQYSVDTTIPTVSVVTRWTQWGHRGEVEADGDALFTVKLDTGKWDGYWRI